MIHSSNLHKVTFSIECNGLASLTEESSTDSKQAETNIIATVSKALVDAGINIDNASINVTEIANTPIN
ncbi:hypothetical protein LMH73_027870 [Vibrio splendidus]|nr:hypothetical protein [Vibrio splendidus]MCC4882488.1 hypothetical protein [Vibrio splendidus]